MEKRGASHFEMIISFIFFITFVTFLLLVIKPYETETLTGSVIKEAPKSLEELTKVNYTEFFLKLNNAPNNCFSISPNQKIFNYPFSKSIVTDATGADLNSEINGNTINIKNSGKDYKVYLSPEFNDDTLSSCTSLTEDEYQIGGIFEKKLTSYKELQKIQKEFQNNYDNLKNNLKIPKIYDFAIISTDLPELNMKRQLPSTGNIQASEFLLEVLKSDGSITNTRFTIQIW